MDDAELFDVFNIDNNPEPVQTTVHGQQQKDKPKKPKKPKDEKQGSGDIASNGVTGKRSHEQFSTKGGGPEQEVGGSASHMSKKPRKPNNAPVVVDSFETESDQIVPATQGLQGIAVTDQNIVIKKRVNLFYRFI